MFPSQPSRSLPLNSFTGFSLSGNLTAPDQSFSSAAEAGVETPRTQRTQRREAGRKTKARDMERFLVRVVAGRDYSTLQSSLQVVWRWATMNGCGRGAVSAEGRGESNMSVRVNSLPGPSATSAPPRLCVETNRRAFLSNLGMGFAGMAMGAMLARDGVARAAEIGTPQRAFPASAEGQVGHLDLPRRRHEPDGELRPQAGAEQVRRQDDRGDPVQGRARIALSEEEPARVDRRAAQGASQDLSDAGRLSEARPERPGDQRLVAAPGRACADDLASSAACGRPTTTTGPSSSSTPAGTRSKGRSRRSARGCITAWARSTTICRSSCVLGTPLADCCGGVRAHGANYLGPEHDGIQLAVDPAEPAAVRRARTRASSARSRRGEFELLGKLNRLAGGRISRRPGPGGPHQVLRAGLPDADRRAGRRSTSPPNRPRRTSSTASTRPRPKPSAGQCLAARRLVERGVRFVQVFHGSNGGAGAWDAHGDLKAGHSKLCGQVDQPIAGLIDDLKQRGLLERNARRHRHRVRPHARGAGLATAATIIPTASRSPWPAAASRGASSTARPTSSASTPSRTATTSPTSTPRCSTSSASIRAGSKSPAASGSNSTSASRSGRSWRSFSPHLTASRASRHACLHTPTFSASASRSIRPTLPVEQIPATVAAELARLKLAGKRQAGPDRGDHRRQPRHRQHRTWSSRRPSSTFKSLGAKPFIVPAMGSHGGGTAEGQRELIEGYGITEEYCGCPIRASMETVDRLPGGRRLSGPFRQARLRGRPRAGRRPRQAAHRISSATSKRPDEDDAHRPGQARRGQDLSPGDHELQLRADRPQRRPRGAREVPHRGRPRHRRERLRRDGQDPGRRARTSSRTARRSCWSWPSSGCRGCRSRRPTSC